MATKYLLIIIRAIKLYNVWIPPVLFDINWNKGMQITQFMANSTNDA